MGVLRILLDFFIPSIDKVVYPKQRDCIMFSSHTNKVNEHLKYSKVVLPFPHTLMNPSRFRIYGLGLYQEGKWKYHQFILSLI